MSEPTAKAIKATMAEAKLRDGRKIRATIFKIDILVVSHKRELTSLHKRRADAIRQLLDLHAEPNDPPLDFDGNDAE